MKPRHLKLLEALLWLAAALVVIGVGLLLGELLLSKDPDEVVVAGSLGLILTQTVALIAALMRRASETESEQRMLMESGMRAIELIHSEEHGGSTAQSGAALVVLSRLDHHDLALSLLEALWPDDQVNPEAATVVVDLGLQSQNEIQQATAASLLSHHGAKTVPEGGLYYLPATLNNRQVVANFSDRVLYPILSYLIRVTETILLEQPEINLTDRAIRLNSFMPIALGIGGLDDDPVQLQDDPDDLLRTTAVRLVEVVMQRVRNTGISGIPTHQTEIPFDELDRRIARWLSDHNKVNMALFIRIVKIAASS